MLRFASFRALRTVATLLALAALSTTTSAKDFKVQDRVYAPYGGELLEAIIVGGPNSRGEWRVHFDRTDSSRDKWLTPGELAPFVELGVLKPGDLIQVNIVSNWNLMDVVEVRGDEVLAHKLNHTHENDAWYPVRDVRRPPPNLKLPPPWPYPYLLGEFVLVDKGGPKPEAGRFEVERGQVYVSGYRVSDISRIVGRWEPRFRAGDLARLYVDTRSWQPVRIDKPEPGSYKATLLRTNSATSAQEDLLAPEWDYDGFYALAAPLFADDQPLRIDWLTASDRGTDQGFTVTDAQLKAGLRTMIDTEKALLAKYPSVPGTADCRDCPAMLMDLLARRKQVVLKACGHPVDGFVTANLEGYQRHLDAMRQGTFWGLPISFGATDVAATVAAELAQNEADLAADIARNKLIDPDFTFSYDRQPLIDFVVKAQEELAANLVPFDQLSSDMSEYSAHDALAEKLAVKHVMTLDPQAKIVGKFTLRGGWRLDEKWDVNTAQTELTIKRRLITTVLVKTTSPNYKFPVAYSLTLYREGGPAYVHEQSLVQAFYK
jgi:hypothetical protein